MTAQTPAQVAQNWAQRLGASGDKMTAGANGVTVAPGQLAARQKNVWQQNTVNAADKWAKNTSAVTLQDWQAAFVQKGVPRVASGATAAQPKMENFMTQLLPYQQQALSTLPARGTYEQNKNRAMSWMDKMHAFNYKPGA